MLRLIRRIIFIFRPLLNGNYKSFALELKVWGPGAYKRYIKRKYCEGFKSTSPEDIKDLHLRNLYQKFCDDDYIKVVGQDKLVNLCLNMRGANSVTDDFGRRKAVLPELTISELEKNTSAIVFEVISLIYGRPFWIRDQAFIMEHSPNKAKNHIQADWHVDGYNQITLTLLLEDSQPDAVATEIMIGSSRSSWSFDRSRIEVLDDYETEKFVGKAGDLFIFFGGGALHRSYIGNSGRKAVFINLSSGWYEAGVT